MLAHPALTRPRTLAVDWSFRLLGPLEVLYRGAVRRIPPGRQQTLLAALLLQPNQVVPAPTLIEYVWGNSRARADRSMLNVYVMRLRRSLGDPDRLFLLAENGGYRLAVDEPTVDLYRFRRLCAEAREDRKRGRLAAERAKLHKALALWQGEPFSGISSPSIQSEVVPIVYEERLGAIERRIQTDLDHDLHDEVVHELRKLVLDHPFRERVWCQLMLALYRSGRQAEALAAYRSVRQTLIDEVGVEPGAELRDLHQRILTEDRSLLCPISR